MKPLLFILIGCLGCLGVPSACEAGGFFRRVPEVGEWARYDLVMLVVATLPDIDAPAPDAHESTGSLTLKCVGEETIDGVRHLWIESCVESSNPDSGTRWTVLKLLVPADRVTDSDMTSHVVRGWVQRDDLDASESNNLNDPYSADVMLAFPAYNELMGREQNKTLTLGNETLRLTQAESGTLETFQIDDNEATGEITMWPSADHAFGVAAGEQLWTMQTHGMLEMTIEFDIQMDLAETGTDAVSDLPDNN